MYKRNTIKQGLDLKKGNTQQVYGEKVNQGAGYGLKIPVRACLSGHWKVVRWTQQKLEALRARAKS